MIHPTYRKLDEPPRVGPFTLGQWTLLGLITFGIFGFTRIVPLRTEYAVCLWMLACGLPVIGWVLSEGDRPSVLRLARAAVRWLLSSKQLHAGPGQPRIWVIKTTEPLESADRLALPSTTTTPDFPELPE